MKPEKIKKISDILFVFSIIFAAGVMFKNWYDQRGLPEGVCPIENNSTWMMLAITLLVISFIVTSIIDYRIKKQDRKEKNT
jgi:heme/copper-type cytochrome/quinol oxidase subunit 2